MKVLAAATIGEASRELETQSWSAHCKPPISYGQALRSYFIWAGQCYSVQNAPTVIWAPWLASVTPATASDIAVEPEQADRDERMLYRFYALCVVMKGRNKARVTLYATQEEARYEANLAPKHTNI